MTYAYLYSREEGTLALAEAEACHLTNGKVAAHGVVVGNRVENASKGAYLRRGGELIATAKNVEKLCEQLIADGVTADDFKIISEPIPRGKSGAYHAIIAVAEAIEGDVDLINPKTEFLLVLGEDSCWLIKPEPEVEKNWLTYKHKPFQFCNALPVQMGKALINLACDDVTSVFDPCCGSGTIPMLAAEAGLTALAGDKSWPNMNISRNNINHYGLDVEIKQEDAITTTRTAECIITNLPYGLYLPLAEDKLIAMLQNFRMLAPKVILVTTVEISERLQTQGYSIERHIVAKRHNFTRNIYFTKS